MSQNQVWPQRLRRAWKGSWRPPICRYTDSRTKCRGFEVRDITDISIFCELRNQNDTSINSLASVLSIPKFE